MIRIGQPQQKATPSYPDPSWSRVWWTTVRVFARRWFGAGRLRTGLLVVLVLASVATAAAVVIQTLAPAGTTTRSPGPARPQVRPPAPITAAAAARAAAATWVVGNVSATGVLACDTATCTELESQGYPAAALVPLTADGADIRKADLVAVTTTVRTLLGRNLRELVAAQSLAVFGTGAEAVEIRAVTTDGPEAYQQRLAADRGDRRAAGRELAGSDRLQLTAQAREQLVSGQVDARLLIVLPALLADYSLSVRGFSASPAEDPGAPLRILEIDRIDGEEVSVNSRATRVVGFLDAQWPPFLPAGSLVVDESGRDLLQITYAAPSPLGLLGTG